MHLSPHPILGKHWKGNRKHKDTYKKQEAFVLTDGTAAAKETQQEEHRSHSQHDVRSREEQRVGSHYLSKTCGIHNDPDPNSEQACSSQLSRHKERRERGRQVNIKQVLQEKWSHCYLLIKCSLGEFVFLHGIYSLPSRCLLTCYSVSLAH